MKSQMKTVDSCTRLLEVKAEEDDVRETRASVVRDFVRASRIPGFRVGKAPEHLVHKQYEKEIHSELLKRLLPELTQKALETSKMTPLGPPEISDIQWDGTKLAFKAKVETKPEIPLKKFKGLKVSRKAAAVSPEEVEKNLRALQEDRAELVPKTGEVAEDDIVVCDIEGCVDGKMIESRKNILVPASKTEKHPEISEALFGAKAGETREADVTLESPGGVIQKFLYSIRIHDVKEKRLPELNDAFAKGASPFQTLEALK